MPQAFAPDAGVEAIWHSRTDMAGRYRVLPDGRCDLVLRYADSANGPVDILMVLTGAAARFHDIDLIPGTGFIGARFKPGHAARFLGLSPSAIPQDGLRGTDALARCPWLTPLLAPAMSHAALVDRLAGYLAASAQKNPRPSARSRTIAGAFHASAGRLGVAEIARIHRMSSRHLAREWRELTGFAPKTYGMILQFQHALRLMQQSGLSATAAAHEAGYADQAHMSRAFRRFGGFTPAKVIDVTLVSLLE
jgi:AraC-like DNA-binding protein